jgi:hypothetical protein
METGVHCQCKLASDFHNVPDKVFSYAAQASNFNEPQLQLSHGNTKNVSVTLKIIHFMANTLIISNCV